MSKIVVITCLALALASATVVQASDLPWRLSLGGAFNKPVAHFGDVSHNGNHFNLSLERQVMPAVAVGIDVGRHAWNANDAFNLQASINQSLKVDPTFEPFTDTPIVKASVTDEVVQYTAHARYLIPVGDAPVSPWLSGGMGGYTVRTSLVMTGYPTEKHDNSFFGFNAGGGVDYAVSPTTSIGAGATYHFIPSQQRIGEDITSLAIGAHVSYAFGSY